MALSFILKKYAYEQPINIKSEDGTVLFDYTVAITGEEYDRIFTIIEEIEEAKSETTDEQSEEILDIIYKDHKEALKDLVGEYNFDSYSQDIIMDIVGKHIDQRLKQQKKQASKITAYRKKSKI